MSLSASVEGVEQPMVGSLEGMVTVGAESAARLGVPVGTEIPLGVLASTDPAAVLGTGAHEKAHLLRERGEA